MGSRCLSILKGTYGDLKHGVGLRAMPLPALQVHELGGFLLNDNDLDHVSDLVSVIIKSPEYKRSLTVKRTLVPYLVLASSVIKTAKQCNCYVIVPKELFRSFKGVKAHLMAPDTASYFLARYALTILARVGKKKETDSTAGE